MLIFLVPRILVAQMASDDAGATSGLHEELTFSAEQLVVIDRLIAARVAAASVPASCRCSSIVVLFLIIGSAPLGFG